MRLCNGGRFLPRAAGWVAWPVWVGAVLLSFGLGAVCWVVCPSVCRAVCPSVCRAVCPCPSAVLVSGLVCSRVVCSFFGRVGRIQVNGAFLPLLVKLANQGAFCFPGWPISAFRSFGLDPVAGYLNWEPHRGPSWRAGAPGSRPVFWGPVWACSGALVVSLGLSRSLSVSLGLLGSLVACPSVAVLLGLARSVCVPGFPGPPLPGGFSRFSWFVAWLNDATLASWWSYLARSFFLVMSCHVIF